MADRKITDLTALAAGSQATGDLLTIVDVSESAAADKNKKITVESLFKGIPGDVGIGVASPGRILHVDSGSTSNSYARFTNNNSVSNGAEIGLFDSGAAGPALVLNNTMSDGVVVLNTNSLERMRIDSTGNVGVGGSAVPTFGGYNTATLHLRQASSGSNGSQLRMTTGASGHTASDGAYLSFWGGDNNVYLFNRENASISFGTNDTERMRLNSSGNLGIGTSSPAYELDVRSSDTTTVNINAGTSNLSRLFFSDTTVARGFLNYDHSDDSLKIGSAGSERMRIDSNGVLISSHATINGGVIGTNGNELRLQSDINANGTPFTSFYTGSSERMRISSDGDLLIGQSSTDTPGFGNTTLGAAFENLGADGVAFFASRSNNICAGFNRAQDGAIVQFASAGNVEGSISISGSTTSYNGAHLSRWTQLAGGAERTEILRGSVLSNLDEMCEWGEEDNEQLNRMKVSDVEGDVNVSGVFQAWDDDDDTYTNDFYCAMTGDFIIRIAQGTTVARGDLLMSAGDGTAKPQDDDIVRSKTIAKVTSTTVSTTYADGSYCVPCVLMAC